MLTIVGARPQFIKAAALSRCINTRFAHCIDERLLHTGQHYDQGMSEVFFAEMGIPQPAYRLNIGSGPHGQQTGRMLEGIEQVCTDFVPDAVVVYGDTNSTLAGALAGVKMHIPVVHIEAGLRSFNKRMPEEVNRITADQASTLLFSPTLAGVRNLHREGFLPLAEAQQKGRADVNNPYVIHCGDLMYDNTLHYATEAAQRETLLDKLGLRNVPFVLGTIHRPQNTDSPSVLMGIMEVLASIGRQNGLKVVLPLHPRTANIIKTTWGSEKLDELNREGHLCLIDPVGFLEMLVLQRHATMIMTDSGGVQKEAFFMKKPCVILRPETEWEEIVEAGCAQLAGADPEAIRGAFTAMLGRAAQLTFPPVFGSGDAAGEICQHLIQHLG